MNDGPESNFSKVLVIGGSGGLGGRLVADLDDAAVELCFTSRRPGGGDRRELACDLRDESSIETCVSEAVANLGSIGGLVVMAGTMDDALLVSSSAESLRSVVDVNLVGSMLVVRAILPHFLENRFGRIVLVGSSSGLRGSRGQANYAASKAGLIGLARSVTLEYASRNITCNVLSAGFVDAGMAHGLSQKRRDALFAQIPAGRFATATEISRAVQFLLADQSGYINGTVLTVDGGYGMGY